jgi:hypothetical protein
MGADLRIFLTYRRDDSAGQTGRIADRLRREFGEDSLFMDVDGIPLGVDFHRRINDEVARCDVLIAAIGNRWIDLTDQTGQRRIDNPLDFVRIEISAALRRDIPLIPILLDGTKIPNAQLLPEEVKGLAARNGLDVRHATFHSDLDRLVRELRQISDRDEAKVEAPKPIAGRNEHISNRDEANVEASVLAARARSTPQRRSSAKRAPKPIAGRNEQISNRDEAEVEAPKPIANRNEQISDRDEAKVDAPKPIAGRNEQISKSVLWRRIAGGVTVVGVISVVGVIAVVAVLPPRSPVALQPTPAVTSRPALPVTLQADLPVSPPPAPSDAPQDANAMFKLGERYEDGDGVARDYGKAREWYEKAAAKGNLHAMNSLSRLYGNGQGVARDYAKEREWLEKAAAKDDVTAMMGLAWFYEHGHARGETDPFGKAREWYEKAAAKGDEDAKLHLGLGR